MQKTSANLLLVAVCTGLILAGCNQKPAQTTTPAANTKAPSSTQEANGSISIQESKGTTASMSITPAVPQTTVTDGAGVTITPAPADAAGTTVKTTATTPAGLTPEAQKALDDANKAMADAKAASEAAAKAIDSVPAVK